MSKSKANGVTVKRPKNTSLASKRTCVGKAKPSLTVTELMLLELLRKGCPEEPGGALAGDRSTRLG